MTPRSPSEPSKAADPLLGAVVDGKYRIREIIGRGGVGIVYLAERLADAHEVVIKIIAPNWLGSPEILARFDREIERLSGLQHPNVVALLDFGRHDGRTYMVMEYIQGESLKSFLARKGRLALEDFVPIASQILKGIGYAHTRGLMHRDLNPSNIMLCEREGRAHFVKILDFGLAKLKEGEAKVTEQHDLVGTAGFLAPEQIKGEDVDLRVDVYALGVMFYLMLSGRMPFEGEHNATLLYKHVHEKPRPLVQLLPLDHGIPEHLLRLIEDCLEKDPSQRPNDADEIVEDLIDCVPAAYFSLPRIPKVPVGAAEPGATMIGLGVPSPAAPSETKPRPGISPILLEEAPPPSRSDAPVPPSTPADPVPRSGDSDTPTLRTAASLLAEGLDASTSSLRPARSFAPTAAPAPVVTPEAPVRRGGGLFVGAAVAILLGAGAAYYILNRPAAPPAAPTMSAAEVAAVLDRAEAAIIARDYDGATRELDHVKAFLKDHPAASARHDRISERLVVGRLLLTADKLANEGNRGAAIAAYKDVLARDATNAEAREALARLNADGTVAEDKGSVGSIVVVSTPIADLTIDGASAGTTPFSGQLAVGQHTVRMEAPGHQPWESTIEVLADKNAPLQVSLRPLPRVGRGGKASADPAPVKPPPGPPASDPQPAPEPKPAPPPEKKPEDDVFLPTSKKGKDGGIFMPVGDSA